MMNYLQKKKQALLNYVQSGGRLPSEYQEVEWIGTQGQGGEYLILQQPTNIAQYDTFQIGVELNSGTNEQGFWGVDANADAYFHQNKFQVWAGISSSQSGTTITPLTKYDLEWYANRNISTPYSFKQLLFAYRTNAYYFNGKIYYFKWLDSNNELKLDLVPCYRKADNEIGMYDTVNDTFFTNQGTGTFTKGQDV